MRIEKDGYEVKFKSIGDDITPIYETDIYKDGQVVYNILSRVEVGESFDHKADIAIFKYESERTKWSCLEVVDLKNNKSIEDQEPVLMNNRKHILLEGEIIEFYFWGDYISPFYKVSILKEKGLILKKHKPVFTMDFRRDKIASFKAVAEEVLKKYREEYLMHY